MEKIVQALRRSLLYLLGFSAFPLLTSCYGVPQDHSGYEVDSGRVLNKDMEPIKGIRVTYRGVDKNRNYTLYTDDHGYFDIYERKVKGRIIVFEDVDGQSNGGEFEMQTYLMQGNEKGLTISMDIKK